MAENTQESFFTLIERDPATCQIIKEVSCKSVNIFDEDGNFAGVEVIELETKTYEVVVPVVEAPNGNVPDEPVVQPDEPAGP